MQILYDRMLILNVLLHTKNKNNYNYKVVDIVITLFYLITKKIRFQVSNNLPLLFSLSIADVVF